MTALEIAANGITAASIVLAGRNSVHTWWTGIIGCLLFGWLFFDAKLYADVVLQAFFVVTSVVGWWQWHQGPNHAALPIRDTRRSRLLGFALAGAAASMAYGALLHRFTDAYAPFADSVVLAFSVVAQLLMMNRRIECWPFWLLVNTVAVPLYASRELLLTATLYGFYWLNAIVAWRHWRRLQGAQSAAAA